MNIVVVLHSYL